MRACTPGLRTCLPTYALLPSTLLLPTLFTGERMMLVLGLGQGCGGPSETQVRKTILLTGGIPFPHLCCVLVALLPLNVSVPGGRGEVSPHAPEPDQKPWLLLPPLMQMLRCTKPTMTTKKRPCTAALSLSVLFCPSALPGLHEVRGANTQSSRGHRKPSLLDSLQARTLCK